VKIKRAVLSALFLFFSAVCILFSSPVSIGIALYDPLLLGKNFSDKLFNILDQSLIDYPLSEAILEAKFTKEQETIKIKTILDDDEEAGNDYSENSLELKKINISNELIKSIINNDNIVSKFVFDREEIDLLLLLSLESIGNLINLKLYISPYGSFNTNNIYFSVVEKEKLEEHLGESALAVSNYLAKQSLALLYFPNREVGFTVELNGLKKELKEKYLIIPTGNYNLKFNALGYESENFNFIVDKPIVDEIKVSFKKEEKKPLLITSSVVDFPFSLLDNVDLKTDYLWMEQEKLFSIYYEQEGVFHSTKSEDLINLQFKSPLQDRFKYDLNYYQKRTYSSLARTLILAALTIATQSIVENLPNDSVKPLIYGTSFLTILSAFDTASHLFDYYKKTKYSF